MTVSDDDATEIDPEDVFDLSIWQNLETAQEVTRVGAIYDEEGFVRRTDDVLVGAAQVEGRDVTLSEAAQSGSITAQFGKGLAQLDEATDLWVTSVPYDIDEHLEHYQSRLTDEDVANRPILQELARGYIQHVNHSIRTMNMTDRRMFIIRSVDLANVELEDRSGSKLHRIFSFIDDESPLGQALDGTWVGAKIGIGAGTMADNEAAVLERGKEQLDEEMAQAMRALNMVSGLRTERLSGGEVADLVRKHWNPTAAISSRWKAPRVPFPDRTDEVPALRKEVSQ